jgi:hypothetical protein
MARAFFRGLVVIAGAALMLAHPRAAGPAQPGSQLLQRFLSLGDPTPSQVRALRHLEATNERFEKAAWMDVWTDADSSGFRYDIVAEGGSEYIRSHVMRAWLEAERKMWATGAPEQAGITEDNYTFEDRGTVVDGLSALAVRPRRKDLLLVEGSIFLNPSDGELVRMEGRLTKSPSFWTRRVDIVKWYRRVAGFRMPVALDTSASLRVAGHSTFRVTYDYESVDRQRVGNPIPHISTF